MTPLETIPESLPTRTPGLEVTQVSAVTVARITAPELLHEAINNAIARRLFTLVEEGCRRLVLSFASVKQLDSTTMSKIIGLHKRLRAAGGLLVLCTVDARIYAVLATLRLDQLFSICGTEQEAVQSFS